MKVEKIPEKFSEHHHTPYLGVGYGGYIRGVTHGGGRGYKIYTLYLTLFKIIRIFINMKNNSKEKLRRRGEQVYLRYFFNSDSVIEYIVKCLDNKIEINNNECETVFDISLDYKVQIYELVLYYPNKLKEIKFINKEVINEMYSTYGETIELMKLFKKPYKGSSNIRGKMCSNVSSNAFKRGILCSITSEDIILKNRCSYLDIELNYVNNKALDNSASIDRINPTLGYVKGNIEVISLLANKMKSNANIEQQITFAKKILEKYEN